jgi:flagellar biosynthetic protein FliP
MRRYKLKYCLTGFVLLGFFINFFSFPAMAQQGDIVVPKITFGIEKSQNTEDVALSLQILAILTVLSLAPAILVLSTCFTRIIIVLSFTRRALGTQQIPSNQILIGLALFLTLFAMGPTFDKINESALQPYLENKINTRTALENGAEHLRTFMFRHTREKDISLLVKLSGEKNKPEKKSDVSLKALLPAYIISEMKTAFQMGIMIFIPFLVVDMIVASTLMSMGMIMLPPIMISLPFKLLLFVMVDGWELIIESLMLSLK